MGKIGIGIPDGIDSGASDGTTGRFENQKTITKVVFGNNCTYVGSDAFENCELLSEINEDNVIETIGPNAFAGTALTSAKFEHLTKMDLGAFYGCEELKSITMPNVTSIPDDAFKGCTNLTDIDLNNCISIGENAFENCKNIKEITLSKCETIGSNAFADCKGLSRVYIKINSDKVCEIGDNVFYIYDENGNGNINENILFFVLPDKIDAYKENWKTYENYMLPFVDNNQIIYKTNNGEKIGSDGESDIDGESDSDGITKYTNKYEKYGLIEFDADLKSLNDKIFSQTGTLTSIYLPNTCERIGEEEFYKCTNLIDIILPDILKYIDDFAFAYCKAFKSFEIPETIETLGEGIFMGCENLKEIKGKFVTEDGKSIVCNNTLIYVLPKDDRIKLNISDIDKNITKLGKGCLYGYENLIRVDIPSNITEIGDNAFEGCKNLREIHFHGDVPTLGEDIFGKIKDINKDIKIFAPEAKFKGYYENIQSGYLQYLRPMPEDNTIYFIDGKKINALDEKVTHNTRQDGASITYYKTPNLTNLTIIPSQYYAETNVKEVIFAESYTEIVPNTFIHCEELTYVYLNKIKKLGMDCFSGCIKLKSISIPESVTEIGEAAFFNSALTSIVIPKGVNKIEPSTFYSCDNLTNVTIPDSVTSIGSSAFNGCTSLTSIAIPDSVTSIGNMAFYNCTSLESVTIGSLLTIGSRVASIGNYAFYNCSSLTSITIPDNVTSIGEAAFKNCSSLTSVNCKPTTPPTGGLYMFDGNSSNRLIYVPFKSTTTYKIKAYWKNYASQIVGIRPPLRPR